MGSTWTPLTAQLEGKEGAERSRGLNRRQVCLDVLIYPSTCTKCSIHSYKSNGWKEVVYISKAIDKGKKQGRKSVAQKAAVAIQIQLHSLLSRKFTHLLQQVELWLSDHCDK